MSNPSTDDSEAVEQTLRTTRRERRRFIESWAEYVRTHPDSDWGEQVNCLVDAGIAAVRRVEDQRPELDELDSPLLDE